MSFSRQRKMTSFTVRRRAIPIQRWTATGLQLATCLLVASLVATGCSLSAREKETVVPPSALNAYLADKPEPLQELYATALRQGQRNLVLNQMRAGLAAMELGAWPIATESFDQALQGIEAVYANSPTAAEARKKFTLESYKDFKGEPYERAMAYYYRGLLYLRQGDYENARASFKGGMLQDAFAEEEQHRSDFALLAFLDGWASHCARNKDLAKESFDEVSRLKPDTPLPGLADNVLLVAETGTSPVKYGDGPKNSLLKYRRGDGFDEAKILWSIGRQSVPGFPIEDIYWQASTRGGRPVDYILAGKVAFKENAATTGQVMKTVGLATMVSGAQLGHNYGGYVGAAGAVVTLGGFIAQGISDAVRPEADARYWDNLPDSVHIRTVSLSSERRSIDLNFLDTSDNPVAGLPKTTNVEFAGRCGIAWTRSRSAIPTDPRAPNSLAK